MLTLRQVLEYSAVLVLVPLILWKAYDIRMHAIRVYGYVIHEFDPWFNFRATQYLADNGLERFFKWFDYMSWYPLGRPIGTTIFPGMQITSVVIWRTLQMIGVNITLNDVCCLVPAWFGAVASALLGLLTAECSNSIPAGIAACAVMSVIPAHLMRSIGGGYDNESVAMSAMCGTWWLWCRSLRSEKSWPVGVLTGLMYIYMVAAWGGYVFVLNLIGVHAAVLCAIRVLRGRPVASLALAYGLFYAVGTAGAVQVPVVGWTPLRSLEQLGALAVFVVIQLLWLCEEIQRRRGLSNAATWRLRCQVFGSAVLFTGVIVSALLQMGYFQPLGARIRGLFLKHTRTGNPLVDSVAEHQPSSVSAYWHYLQGMVFVAPIGLVMVCAYRLTEAKSFLVVYAAVAYQFSSKMSRLLILMGPITSALSGIVIGTAVVWSIKFIADAVQTLMGNPLPEEPEAARDASLNPARPDSAARPGSKKKGSQQKEKKRDSDFNLLTAPEDFAKLVDRAFAPGGAARDRAALWIRFIVAIILLGFAYHQGRLFLRTCEHHAEGASQPSLMFRTQLSDGRHVIISDYLDSYQWLKENTKEDARVLAWWDYGYQITGIANRTSIADGNTWNHEHIATLGRMLTSPERKAHAVIRHVADYVLIWCQSGGDLGKSPHMARIGNSVFDDICPGDPTCRRYGFENDGSPTPMMAASLLYKLHQHNRQGGYNDKPVQANSTLWKEVYSSPYGLVRIFKVLHVSKESKQWIADPANRVCDAPGSWYCTGQYPPALQKLIDRRRNFAQLEDFNTLGKLDKEARKKHEEYQREYHRRMGGS
eukprot:TRINITY_DN2033_c0_g3_i5.p1 TRINITY_DN2033_c0_g3~~TRINITY_DN2033_c0_g3_i5.p1  ORF type:complete len:817 (+),score=243.33 TRINITY_DN2033_c0_g3_i5:126-2576(+)